MNEFRNCMMIGLWTLCAGSVGCGGGDNGPSNSNAGGDQQSAGASTIGGNRGIGGATGQLGGGTSSNPGGMGNSGSATTPGGMGSGGTASNPGSTTDPGVGGAGGTSTLAMGGVSGALGGTSSEITVGGSAALGGAPIAGTAASGSGSASAAGGSSGVVTATAGASGGSSIVVALPSHLSVNGLSAPLDLDVTPRFGWHANTADQFAYEIRVSSTRAKAEALEGDLWTTGKVASRTQNGISYAGSPLALSERYFWRARHWAPDGSVSNWSDVASFGTGPGSSWSSSQPIWALADSSNWTDYTITSHLTVNEIAVGIRFRAPDTNNGYMWQFRGSDNRLVPHRLQNGSFTVIETVTLPSGTLTLGKEALVRIEATGATLRTFVDGVLVHTLVDSMFSSGGVGVRTGSTESGSLADLSVVAANGQSLLQSDFATGDRTFGCGSVSSGAFQVPKGTHCLTRGFSVDWAFLRKEFTLADKPIAWATVYATATSPVPARQYVYKLHLNGKFVGLGPTQSIASEARYDGFDVTSLLQAGGSNALGVLAYTTKGQSFQAELIVEYTDGTRELIGTDKTWKARSGDYVFPPVGSIGTSYFVAPKENVGAKDFPNGFDAPGFDDNAWSNAGEKSALGSLAAAPMAKVKEQLLPPVQIVEKGVGNYFIDFGRTWVGGIQYQIDSATSGSTVEIRFGEVTSAANTVRYQLNTGNTYQDIYTLSEGSQVFRTWGMRVFRYV
ncbi:MAG TPA: alpha-L-rhamnosidase N-terminal domain-containing protein, partial [Polyangiaceae bacterium]|nr:alpha-L-rhamnosidase N-terminal domain-containing protein [Polyangiaceae bacterium]